MSKVVHSISKGRFSLLQFCSVHGYPAHWPLAQLRVEYLHHAVGSDSNPQLEPERVHLVAASVTKVMEPSGAALIGMSILLIKKQKVNLQ